MKWAILVREKLPQRPPFGVPSGKHFSHFEPVGARRTARAAARCVLDSTRHCLERQPADRSGEGARLSGAGGTRSKKYGRNVFESPVAELYSASHCELSRQL